MNEVSEEIHGTQTLLSILIPVYNGEKYLRHLLGMFANAYSEMPEHFAHVEIIVANNVSEDATQSVAESFAEALPMLRPLSLSPHLPTAEENVFRSFAYCNGIYTWALGVDDIPNFSMFSRMLAMIELEEADFFLFNFPSVTEKMHLQRTANFFMGSASRVCNIVDLAQRFGYWYVVAGISGQIMRTAFVRNYDLTGLVAQTGKIYAHVTAYLDCFHAAKTLVVNIPLIFYKVTFNDLDHWKKTAAKMGVFDNFLWTLGYVRQLKYLEDKRVIPRDFLRYMLEQNESHYFRPMFVVTRLFGDQVRHMSETKDQRNHIRQSDFNELYEYLIARDPFVREYLWKLRDIYNRIIEGDSIKQIDWHELEKFHTVFHDFLFASLLQRVVKDHEIYRVGRFYYGVRRDDRNALVERLGFLFDEESPPEVFMGSSEEEVVRKIENYDSHSDEAHHRAVDKRLIHLLESTDRIATSYRDQLATTRAELNRAVLQFELVRQSTSWRITKPLRDFSLIAKKLFRR